MPAPSISSLLNYLYNYVRALARVVFGTGSWDSVDYWREYVYSWFDYLIRWVKDRATAAANAIYLILATAYNDLRDYTVAVRNTVTSLVNWVNDWGNAAVSWINTYKSKLQYVAVTLYGFLKSFYERPVTTVTAWLGNTWLWLKALVNDPYTRLTTVLGAAWLWVVAFRERPVTTVTGWLGSAWAWVKSLYSDPYGVVAAILGAAWLWVKSFYLAPLTTLKAIVGPALAWLISLYGLKPDSLISFIRDALTFYYNVWSLWRTALAAFLSDPAGFILAAVVDVFLDWLEGLIADAW